MKAWVSCFCSDHWQDGDGFTQLWGEIPFYQQHSVPLANIFIALHTGWKGQWKTHYPELLGDAEPFSEATTIAQVAS